MNFKCSKSFSIGYAFENNTSENHELAIYEMHFADQFCLFADHFKQFFVKFAKQDFLSVIIFGFRETIKFLFTLQSQQFTYILLQKLWNCTLFSCIWIAFWIKSLGGAYNMPPCPLTVGSLS